MPKVTAFFGDHTEDPSSSGKVASISLAVIKSAMPVGVEEVSEMSLASHVIGHFSGGLLREWREGGCSGLSRGNQIILTLTTTNVFPAGQFRHQRLQCEGGEVVVLFSRDCWQLERSTVVERFFSMSMIEAGAAADGEVRKVPRALHRLLFGPASAATLETLAILCQGYLAAHCDPVRHVPDLAEGDREVAETVNSALDAMGWLEVAPDVVNEQLCDPSSRFLLRSKIESPSWWAVAFKDSSLTSRVRQECDLLVIPGHEGDIEAVEVLASLIDDYAEDQSRSIRISPGLVAKCFLALCSLIGGGGGLEGSK